VSDPEEVFEKIGQSYDSEFEINSDVQILLSKLDQKERDIVELHYFDGLTYVSIGKMYGCSGEYIRKIIKKAFDKLKIFIE
jgi:RNA polymerase sigma factor (sigma-70 family)